MAVLGLHCCKTALSPAASGGYSLVKGAGSAVVAQGLGCPTSRGIFSDQRLSLCPLNWQADSSPVDHQRSP